MKKTSIFLITTLIISSIFVSCVNIPNTNKVVKENTTEKKPTEENKKDDIDKESKLYYGTWKINRYVQIKTNKELSASKINSYIGTKFSISKDAIKLSLSKKEESASMENPVFEETPISNDDLKSKWNVTFNNLGLNSKSVNSINTVIVSNYDIPNNNDLKIGSNILIAPNNRAYTIIDGCFYELLKVDLLN